MRRRGPIPARELRQLLAANRRYATAAAELREAVVAAADAGGSVRVIGTAIGRSPTTIQTWLKEEKK